MSNILVNMKFTADVSQAKQQMNDLQNSLNKVMQMNTSSIGRGMSQVLVQDLKEGQQAATQLQVALRAAFNEKTGQLDLTRFNQSMQQSGMSIQKYKVQLSALGPTGQQAFTQLAQSVASAEIPVLRVSEGVKRLMTTFANTARYQLSSNIISGFTSGVQQAFTYAKELNESLNNIRIVTGYSTEQMKEFARQANKAAKELGTTTTAYTDASLIFYQQGLTGDAVKERADVVVQLANVTGQSAEVVSDQMTAIWNNFADGSKEMSYYADVITKLGAATASSTDEISDGLEKFAAVSETVGLSYEMATAALATVTAETRQSADVVGTAFKTIFSRMEGLKLGETLEDGTDLNKYSQALATAGVNIKDQNDQLKDMDTILNELGAKWGILNKDQQIALAQSVAGVRQYNQFIALMGNWDKVQDNLNIAINSTGELNTQAEIYEESWQAASDRVKASLEGIYDSLLNDEFIIKITDFAAKFLNTIENIIDSMGGFKGVAMALGAVLTKMFSQQIVQSITSLQYSLMGLTKSGRQALMQIKQDAINEMSRSYTQQSGSAIGGMQAQVGQAQAHGANIFMQAQQELQPEAVEVLRVLKQQADTLAESAQSAAKIAAEQERTAKATHAATIDEENRFGEGEITGSITKKNKDGQKRTESIISYNTENDDDNRLDRIRNRGKDLDNFEDTVSGGIKMSESSYNKITASMQADLKTSAYQESAMAAARDDEIGGGYIADASVIQGFDGEAINSQSEKVAQFQKTLEQAGGAAKIFGADGAKAFEEYSKGIEKMGKGQKILNDISKANEKANKAEEKYGKSSKKAIKSREEAKKIAEKQKEAEDMVSEGRDQAITSTQKFKAAQDKMGEQVVQTTKDLEFMGKNTDDLVNKNNEAGKSFIQAADGATQTERAYSTMDDAQNKIKTSSIGLGSQMTAIASTMMTAGMAISSLTGLWDTWNNADMSTGEKLIATMTTLGMVIPMVTQALNAQNIAKIFGISVDEKATLSQVALLALEKLGITTKTLETAATAGKTAADVAATGGIWAQVAAYIGLQAAASPILVLTLLIVAAIVALVAIVWVVVAAFKALQASTPEGKLKTLEERADKSAEAFNRVSEAVNETKEAINNLETAYDTIEGLTEGTNEWYEAITNANAEVLKLIEKFPELQEMGFVSQENGLMKISDEGFDYIAEQNRQRLQAANNVKTNDQIAVAEQKREVSYINDYKDTNDYNIGPYLAEAMQNFYEHDQVGETMFTVEGSKALLETLEEAGYYLGYTAEEFHDIILENQDIIRKNAAAADNIQMMNDSIMMSHMASLGSNRTTEQTKELLGENAYQEIRNAKRAEIEGKVTAKADGTTIGFGDWNDHINYSKDDAEWSQIEDFMKLQGDNVKYVAQRHGMMVLEVDGKEIEYTKDEVYDTLAELYSGPELETKLTAKLQETLGKSLGGVDLSGVELSDLTAMDNFRNSIADSLAGTDMEGKTDQVFKGIMDSYGTGQEGIDAFKADTEFIDTLSPEFQDKMQALADGRITVEEFTGALSEMNAEGQIDSMTDFFKQAAKGMGLSEEDATTMQNYAKHLMDESDESDILADSLKKDADSAADLAIEVTRMNKGVDKLADGFEDWSDILENSSEISAEYAEAMGEMKSALADVMDVEADLISNDFVGEHMEDIEKAATGDADAIDRLRAAMDEEIITNITLGQSEEFVAKVNELDAEVHELADNAPVVEVGAILDDADFLAAANNLVEQSGMTADEANAYFAGIGYEPVYSTEDIDNSAEVPNSLTRTSVAKIDWESADVDLGLFGTHSIKLPAVTTKTESVPEDPSSAKGAMRLTSFSGDGKPPQIKGLRRKATGSQNNYSSSNKGGGSPGSGSKKSGGGSGSKSSKETKDKKVLFDEIERYHEIDKRIAASSKKLDEHNNKLEQAYDKDRVGLMRQEVDLLNNSLDLENQKLTEIETNLDKDRKALEAYGAEFDKDGNLINYDEIMNQQLDKLDKAYDRYNKSNKDEDDEKALEKAEERYEKFKKILEQYEETNELHWEQLQTINDKELEIWQKNNDIILEEMEKRVEAFEKATDALGRQIDYLDKKIEKLEDEDFSQALAASLLGKEMGAALEQATKAQEEYKAALAYWEDIKDGVDKDGKEVSQENIDKAWENVMNAADAVDATTETIEGIQEKIDGLLLSHLEDQAEAFSSVSEELEHYNGVLSQYQNILELLGRHYQDDDLMRKLSQSQVDNAEASITNAKAEYDLLTSELEKAKLSGASKETIEELTNQQREAQNKLMDSLSAGLEAVAAKYESDMQIAIKNTEQSLTNGKFYSLEEAQEFYDQQKSIKELYVEEYDKLYQLNKLSRDINKSMSDMDSLLANQKLSGLLDEINEKRESGVEMSQYELDTLQRKYDLRLAEIALEEAQNAKSSMRLTRDSQGNWGYVYTADQDKIDEAQQKYDDAMYNLEKSSREYLDEMQEAILSNEQEMLQRIQGLREDDYANYEEYQNAIEEIRQQHEVKNQYYYDQMGIAIEDINTAYNSQVVTFDKLAIAEVKDIKTIEEGIGGFKTSVDGLLTAAKDSFKTYQENQQDITEAAGLDLDDLTKKMSEDVDKIDEKTKTLKDNIPKIKDKAETAFGGVLKAIQTLNKQYGGEAKKIIDKNNEIMESFLGIYAQEAQVGNYLKGYDENLDYSLAMTEHILNGGQASDAAFIDLIVGRSNKSNDPKYSKWKDNLGGLTQAEAMAVFAIADKSDAANAWVEAFAAGTQTEEQINAAKAALTENVTAYDYIEMMQSYLIGGGKASDDLFHTIWKNFVNKLDEKDTDGQTFKDKWYKNKTLEEIWTQFAVLGAGDSYAAEMPSFATGGYTGKWGPEGKLAMIHEKELILNKHQTEDFLQSLEIMSHIVDTIDRNSRLAAAGLAIDRASTPAIAEKVVQQTVSIDATFPGVQTAIEIEEALNNIINDAVQYASTYQR